MPEKFKLTFMIHIVKAMMQYSKDQQSRKLTDAISYYLDDIHKDPLTKDLEYDKPLYVKNKIIRYLDKGAGKWINITDLLKIPELKKIKGDIIQYTIKIKYIENLIVQEDGFIRMNLLYRVLKENNIEDIFIKIFGECENIMNSCYSTWKRCKS